MTVSAGDIESIMLVNHADTGRRSARERDLSADTAKISRFSAIMQTGRGIESKNNLEA